MPQELSLHLQRQNAPFPAWICKFVVFASLKDFYFQYFHQEGKDSLTSKGAGQWCECAKEMRQKSAFHIRPQGVLILYESPSSIPGHITDNVNHLSLKSVRWFYKICTLVAFAVRTVGSIWRRVAGETKPQTSVFFPSCTFLLNPFFPPLGCGHLSWSLLRSEKMQSTIFLRLMFLCFECKLPVMHSLSLSAAHLH